MNTSDIQTLYAYNRWANQRLFSVLEKVSAEQFTAPANSSFPSVQETVFHILGAEWLWLQRWKGLSPRATVQNFNVTPETLSTLTPVNVANAEKLTTLAGLRSFGDDIERERQEFLSTLTEDALPAPLRFSDMAGTPYAEPLVQLLQHLVNHGSYHRGQVTTMLRQAGAETVALDMLFFFREEAAKAAH